MSLELPKALHLKLLMVPSSIMNLMNVKRLIELNDIMGNLLDDYKDRTVICRAMVWDSFFYINEYWLFNKCDRKKILQSYKRILPKYKRSSFLPHKLASLCGNPFALYLLSVSLWCVKSLRRILLRYKTKAMNDSNVNDTDV